MLDDSSERGMVSWRPLSPYLCHPLPRWRPAAGTARHDGARFTDVQKRRLARLVLVAALVTGAVAGTALGAGGCGATAGDGVTSPPSSSGT